MFRLKKTQKSIFDHDIYLPEHKVRALEKTWAGPFRHQILPFIDEEKFRRLCTIFVHWSPLMTRPARFSQRSRTKSSTTLNSVQKSNGWILPTLYPTWPTSHASSSLSGSAVVSFIGKSAHFHCAIVLVSVSTLISNLPI